ncbi:MAG: recombination-associated protein RdgC [Gammaproteobacteria bacterium]|nr:recombination-associated protein RdgC [Gammaproteobacteria bacterium]NVK88006.1 recombination-associated protein RdgC [Gammaproteobacteria bacterium]
MWFRNIHFYQFTESCPINEQLLVEKLESFRFQPCARQAKESVGFVSPLHRKSDELVINANGCLLFCMRREQKVIPPSTINEALEERVEALEHEQARKVFRKERQQLKEDILARLLPQAFTRSAHILGYIDPKNGYMAVNAGSHAIADTFISLLIDAVGVLGAVKFDATENPAKIMNQWLVEGFPQGFEPTGEYELKDPADERVARFKNNESDSGILTDLVADGFWVSKLGMQFKDIAKFNLHDDMQVKSLKFSDELVNQNDELNIEDAATKFNADFVLMTEGIWAIYQALSEQFQPSA